MFDYVTDNDSNKRKNTKRNPKHTIQNKSLNSNPLKPDFELEVFKSNNTLFENIIGYDNIKKIFSFALFCF